MTLLSPSLIYILIACYILVLFFALYSCFKSEKGIFAMILWSITMIFIPLIGMVLFFMYRVIRKPNALIN